MHRFFRHLAARVILPLGALAVLGAGSAASVSAQGLSCPRLGCTPPQPINLSFQQLITDGGFENAGTAWGLNTGASASSTRAHCGASSLALHTYDTGSTNYFWPKWWAGEATQTVNIPQPSNGVSLDMWVFFPPYSFDHESSVYVLAAARSNGYVYTVIGQYSNATVTPGIWRRLGPIDLSAYQGGPLSLMIEGVTPTDGSSGPIYLDDVSVRTGLQLVNSIGSC